MALSLVINNLSMISKTKRRVWETILTSTILSMETINGVVVQVTSGMAATTTIIIITLTMMGTTPLLID
jgi:hypothetical protein